MFDVSDSGADGVSEFKHQLFHKFNFFEHGFVVVSEHAFSFLKLEALIDGLADALLLRLVVVLLVGDEHVH